jgi:hypothetical protein
VIERIPVPWISDRLGGPRYILVREPSALVFLAGFPGPDADRREKELWQDRILAAVVIAPRLDDPGRLGRDREHVLRTMLERWGVEGPGQLPPAPIRALLRAMARDYGIRPSEILRGPISAFALDYQVLTEADQPAEPDLPIEVVDG